jgi:peptidoglycan DL-endopeptidase CwlO
MRGWPLVQGLTAITLLLPVAASAQKNPGTTIPTSPAPAPAPYRPPPPAPVAAPQPAPAPAPAPALAPPMAQTNPDAENLARRLPLPPSTLNLTNQLPADVAGTERRLGLRHPHGPARDMRGRVPTSEEIVAALAPRTAQRQPTQR